MSDQRTDMGDEPRPGEGESESLALKAGGGFVWALAGFLLLQLGSFGTYSVASRVLDERIGVVAAAMTVVFWIDVLLDLGMGAALIYDQEEGQSERVQVAFTVNAVVATTLSLSVLIGAPVLDSFFRAGDPNLFRVIAVLVLAKGLNQVPDALLKRELAFQRRARADFTRSILRFTIATSLLLAGVGPIAMVSAAAIAEVCAVSVTWWLVRFRPRLRFDRRIAVEMLRFGGAVFGARLVGMLWLNGDYLVVSRHFGSKSREFSSYFTAFRLPELILGSVYNLFSSVAFPTFSKARDMGAEKLRDSSLKALRMLCLFGFPVGAALSLIARDFITVWFGGSFSDAIRPMELLGAVGGFAAIGFASGDVYAAIGKPRLGLYFTLVGAPILIGGFLAVVDHGIVAVAVVHMAVIVPYSLFRIEVANRLLGTTWRQSLSALRPAAVTVAGIVALALPVRLGTTHAGIVPLVAIVAAGVAGAVGGLALGDRAALRQLAGLGSGAVARFR